MLIGELSKKSGLSRDTIRFYEKQGFIKIGRRDRRVNNYKEYSEDVLKRLLLIKTAKSYGFTLNESAEIISLVDAKLASCGTISRIAASKVSIIDKKIAELQALKKLITGSIENCNDRCEVTGEDENCPLFKLA